MLRLNIITPHTVVWIYFWWMNAMIAYYPYACVCESTCLCVSQNASTIFSFVLLFISTTMNTPHTVLQGGLAITACGRAPAALPLRVFFPTRVSWIVACNPCSRSPTDLHIVHCSCHFCSIPFRHNHSTSKLPNQHHWQPAAVIREAPRNIFHWLLLFF